MAVSVECGICEKKIGGVAPNKFRELTGKEICKDCKERLDNTLKEIEQTAKNAIASIEAEHRKVKLKYSKMESALDSFKAQVTDQLRVVRNEIDAKTDEVIS